MCSEEIWTLIYHQVCIFFIHLHRSTMNTITCCRYVVSEQRFVIVRVFVQVPISKCAFARVYTKKLGT